MGEEAFEETNLLKASANVQTSGDRDSYMPYKGQILEIEESENDG